MSVRTARKTAFVSRLLGEVLRVKHGFAFRGEFFGDAGSFVVVTPGSFFEEGGFRTREGKEKRYRGEVPDSYILRKGDLIVAMTEQAEGLLGSAALVPTDNLYLHNQRIGLVVIQREDLADKRFVYYLLNTRRVRQQIRASATGTKVRHTAPERICNVSIEMPSLEVQRRIVSILSAYDDLIENNTRRIAILEEMARSLYREWFVEFRFPGHEKVKMVESAGARFPEGWTIQPLGKLVHELRNAVDPKGIEADTPYIGLEHMPRRSSTLVEWGASRAVESTKLRFMTGDILFGKIRPYFHKVVVAPFDGVSSSDVIVMRLIDPALHGFVLGCVSSDEFVTHATQTSNGTKMPRANWSVLKEYSVPIPPKPTMTIYCRLVDDAVSQAQILALKNRNLRATRDLLLPKLISGEIDVSTATEPAAMGSILS